MRYRLARWLESVWYGRGPARWLLWPLAMLYRCLSNRRRARHLRGARPVFTCAVPVIVVGNITAGGTGKTPLTVWLVRVLAEQGLRCGIVSRGYGGRSPVWPMDVLPDSSAELAGDEPVLLARRTGVPVVVAPDRVAAARRLVARHAVDVVIADDGLQHYRLGRDFEIAVVDGIRGLGNGLCLPAGPLRESPDRLRHVQALVVNGGSRDVIPRHIVVPTYQVRMVASRVRELAGDGLRELAAFRGMRVHAVAGIGRPQSFFELLRSSGIDVTEHAFADHARFAPSDLEFGDDAPILMTEKDAVKCAAFARPGMWYVIADLVFPDDDGGRLLASINEVLETRRS